MTIPPQKTVGTDDIEDPVERMLKKTGCMELHYEVQVINLKNYITPIFYFYF